MSQTIIEIDRASRSKSQKETRRGKNCKTTEVATGVSDALEPQTKQDVLLSFLFAYKRRILRSSKHGQVRCVQVEYGHLAQFAMPSVL